MSDSEQGWLQCSQCGNGFWVRRWEFEVGDRKDRERCPRCLIGFMSVEWEKSKDRATKGENDDDE